MALYQNYPYTDLQTLNLDYVLKKLSDLDAGIESANTAAQSAQESAQTAQQAAEDAQSAVFDRYVTFIGDSYLALTDSTIAEDVAAGLGLLVQKNAAGSMGFYHAVSGQTFIDALGWTSDNIKTATKYLIIYGGINDTGEDTQSVETSVYNCIESAKTLYPNAQILIIGPQGSVQSVRSSAGEDVHGAMLRACTRAGVSYTDARRWLIDGAQAYSDLYKSDKVHPSALGYKVITSRMLNTITGNANGYYMPVALTKAETGDSITAGYTIMPGGVLYYGKGTGKTFTSGIYNNIIKITGMSAGLFGAENNSALGIVFKANNGNPRAPLCAIQHYADSDNLVFARCVPSETYAGDFMFFGFLPTQAVNLGALSA